MYNQSARPQVQYTLDTLSSTLYQLMESQPFSEITVTALCRAAGVGRRSYYHNCDTAEDLVIYRIRKKVRENLSQVDFRCEDAPKLYPVQPLVLRESPARSDDAPGTSAR